MHSAVEHVHSPVPVLCTPVAGANVASMLNQLCHATPSHPCLPPSHHTTQILLVAKKEDITAGAAYEAFKASAVANKGKLVFVTVDASGASKDPVMNFFGIKEEDVPAVGGTEAAACLARCGDVVQHVCNGSDGWRLRQPGPGVMWDMCACRTCQRYTAAPDLLLAGPPPATLVLRCAQASAALYTAALLPTPSCTPVHLPHPCHPAPSLLHRWLASRWPRTASTG